MNMYTHSLHIHIPTTHIHIYTAFPASHQGTLGSQWWHLTSSSGSRFPWERTPRSLPSSLLPMRAEPTLMGSDSLRAPLTEKYHLCLLAPSLPRLCEQGQAWPQAPAPGPSACSKGKTENHPFFSKNYVIYF